MSSITWKKHSVRILMAILLFACLVVCSEGQRARGGGAMSKRGRNNGGGRRLNGQKQGSKRCKKLKGKQRKKCLQKGDIKNRRKGRTNNPKKYVTRYFKKRKLLERN